MVQSWAGPSQGQRPDERLTRTGSVRNHRPGSAKIRPVGGCTPTIGPVLRVPWRAMVTTIAVRFRLLHIPGPAHHSQVVKDVILGQGWHPVMMEHFGSSAEPTLAACLREVGRCDLFLLIAAFRRGWVPALAGGQPCLPARRDVNFARRGCRFAHREFVTVSPCDQRRAHITNRRWTDRTGGRCRRHHPVDPACLTQGCRRS